MTGVIKAYNPGIKGISGFYVEIQGKYYFWNKGKDLLKPVDQMILYSAVAKYGAIPVEIEVQASSQEEFIQVCLEKLERADSEDDSCAQNASDAEEEIVVEQGKNENRQLRGLIRFEFTEEEARKFRERIEKQLKQELPERDEYEIDPGDYDWAAGISPDERVKSCSMKLVAFAPVSSDSLALFLEKDKELYVCFKKDKGFKWSSFDREELDMRIAKYNAVPLEMESAGEDETGELEKFYQYAMDIYRKHGADFVY